MWKDVITNDTGILVVLVLPVALLLILAIGLTVNKLIGKIMGKS